MKKVLITIILALWLLSGWPIIWNNPQIPPPLPEAHAATETIRPTNAYNPSTWSSPGQGYDGNTSTFTSKADLNAAPTISFGGASGGESTNAWASTAQTWTAATLYLTFSKTAGVDDTVEVLITDQNGTLKHTVVSSTTNSVTKQEFSQVLSSSDWGGAGFPNIGNLRVRVNGDKSKGPDSATSYMYDVRIDGSYTPVSVSVNVSDGAVAYGTLATSATQTTLSGGLNDMQTATNDGNVTEDFNIKGQDASGGGCTWTLAGSNSDDQYVHQFCNDTDDDCSSPPTNYTATTTSYQTLKTGVATSGTVDFQLRLTAPTSTSCNNQQSVDITIQAVQQ